MRNQGRWATGRGLIWVLAMLFTVGLVTACGPVPGQGNENNNNNALLGVDGDIINPECDTAADYDGDTISNGDEGCLTGRDFDGDGIPDYQDSDSDNDGLSDRVEAGDEDLATPPVNSDGDVMPDYLDRDSDGDGVLDGDEDRNHDGQLGQCTTPCDPGNPTACAAGQHCLPQALVCVDEDCLGGETSPYATDTDGDGLSDDQEATFICNTQTELNPLGRKPVQYRDHSSGAFQLALEEAAVYREATVTGAQVEVAAWDITDPDHETSGLTVRRASAGTTVEAESTAVIQQIMALPGFTVDVLTSGSSITSHDNYDTVVSTMLAIRTSSSVDVALARNQIISAVTGQALSAFNGLPGGNGHLGSDFIFSYATQFRGTGKTVIHGALAVRSEYETGAFIGFQVDDAGGCTGLAEPSADAESECEFYLADTSVADIIWVIDESGSMDTDQAKVTAAAAAFTQQADLYGLSWRNCVIDMTRNYPHPQCCTGAGVSGGTFVDGADVATFNACVEQPNGDSHTADGGAEYGLTQMADAINAMLPRADTPSTIRPEATLVVFFLTDERANEMDTSACVDPFACIFNPFAPECLDPPWLPGCDTVLQPYTDLLQSENGQAHGLLVPASDTGCSDQGNRGLGYEQLITATGGMVGSICQNDFTATMQLIVQDIAAGSSPVVLAHVPITVSLAAAIERKDGMGGSLFEPLERSRLAGFDYRASSNRIVLINQPMDFPPYQVVVSYERWVTSYVPPD